MCKVDAILDGAIDGRDWPLAALCLLSNPLSARLTEVSTDPLMAMAFYGVIPDDAREHVIRCADLLEAMGNDAEICSRK